MSRLDERFLDELKSRLRLSDVIGRSVKLRRQGREWVGLSPFGKEKSPSFFVNDDKGFFHDFSSGKHGDLIGFLQETERLSFREAVERLAGEAGLTLPAPDPRAAEQEARRQGLSDWMVEAQAWFSAQLRRPAGEAARRYLDKRALPQPEWERFGLGYAPAGRTGLKDHLVAKGARPAELMEAGLLVAPDDGSAPYDRFRDRIIFPIADGRGRVVSFGGRALDPEARAKYLNGPESPLFHKGATLYGLLEARRLLHAAETRKETGAAASLVVVEGYMDVIACQRADIPAVAPLGTALTEEQMEALWRLAPEPVLAFDGDAAGRRAAFRAMDRALPLLKPGRSFRFAVPTGGKDADDVLRDQGAAALREQMAAVTPFVQLLFEREREAEPLSTPESYAGLKVRLRKLAGAIADRDLSQMYREALLDRFEELRTLSRPATTASGAGRALAELRWSGKPRRGAGSRLAAPLRNDATPHVVEAQRRSASAPPPLAAALAEGVLRHPELIDDRFETLNVQGFCDEALAGLARDMLQLRLQVDELEPAALRTRLSERGHAERLAQVDWAAARSAAPFLQPSTPTEEVRALWSQAYALLLRITALNRALADAKAEMERDADLEREPDFLTYVRLKAERDAVERAIASGTYALEDVAEPGGVLH
ncbi:MAG: DNA primase [Caulobacteraceae bacterium]|nr:DNA primase [Caulobacter sp.]